MKIELGCGPNHNKAFFGIDSKNLLGVDLIWDLEKTPIPLEEGCADEIISFHLFEHIQNFIPLMNECHRLLVENGIFRAEVPQVCDINGDWHTEAFQDPTHVRFFVPKTWMYFVVNHDLFHYGRIYGIKPWNWVEQEDKGSITTITLQKFTEIK